MDNSSSGGRQGRPNRQGSRGGRSNQRRRSNRGHSGSRQGGGGRNRNPNRSGGGGPKKEPEKPSVGKKILSILTFGLAGGTESSKGQDPGKNADRPPRRDAGDRPSQTRSGGGKGGRPKKKKGGRKPERLPVTSNRLYVGNLDYDATEQDLEKLFSEVGTVASAEIVTNPRTHQSKGFAFVEMGDVEEAKKAAETLHDRDFMGRLMLVSGAKSSGPRESDDNNASERSSDRPRPARKRRSSDSNNESNQSNESRPPKRKEKVQESLPVTSCRLYVGNLDFGANESDLEDLFRGVGTVASAEVMTDSQTQQSKGFAYVEMSHIDEAKRAVEILNDKDFMGRKLQISGAEEKSEEPAPEKSEPVSEEQEPASEEPESTPEEPSADESPEATDADSTQPDAESEPAAAESESESDASVEADDSESEEDSEKPIVA